MPMAGLGSRFKVENYDLPKPLITINKVPMFVTAISSLNNLNLPLAYTMIVRQEHVASFKIDQIIKDFVPLANIVVTNEAPKGAAVDCFRAKPFIKPDQSVVFMDCDLYFQSQSFNQTIRECLINDEDKVVAGAILYFNSNKDKYSYAKISNGLVTETAEKKVISNNAIAGAYFFNSSKLIFDNLEDYITKQLLTGVKEYYLSPIYNRYIEKNLIIKACPVDTYFSFGTPEELKNYEKYN